MGNAQACEGRSLVHKEEWLQKRRRRSLLEIEEPLAPSLSPPPPTAAAPPAQHLPPGEASPPFMPLETQAPKTPDKTASVADSSVSSGSSSSSSSASSSALPPGVARASVPRLRRDVLLAKGKRLSGSSSSSSSSASSSLLWSDVSRRGGGGASAAEAERLVAAAERGDLKQVQSCLADGVNIDAKDSRGNTALHCAAGNGRLIAVKASFSNVKHLPAQGRNMLTPHAVAGDC
ncbi:Protein of unknown function [Gryllus bimaculatus]|nr:Protein of unknown function [Gryllus bimaculatus]